MGKFSNNKKTVKKKKQNNGYFAQNEKKFGKDFLKTKREEDIKRDAPRIFKDIAFCFGDVGSIGCYFLDKKFVNTLYLYAYNMYIEYDMTTKGLTAYINSELKNNTVLDPKYGVEDMIKTKSKLSASYCIIAQGLNNILNTLTMEKGIDRLALYCHVCAILKQMSLQLKDYRYVL